MIVSAFLALTGEATLDQVVGTAQRLESAGVAAIGLLDGADTGLGPTPFESTTIAARVAAATSTIGVVATDSALYSFPFHSARRLATLDHLSAGRSGWLMRTSPGAGEATAYDWRSTLGRGEELHRATEYAEIERELWDSWEDGAQWPDKAAGDFKDDSRIHPINYRSTSFRVAGPLDTPPTPQRRPVIFTRMSTLEEAGILTPYVDVAIIAPAQPLTATQLATAVSEAAQAAATPVTLLVAGAVGGFLGLPAVAEAIRTATATRAAGVAVYLDPAEVDEALDAVSRLGLSAPDGPRTLAETLGIELPLGGRVA
jgi:alkanesulfonate monooxygenase SsuD/methylene tetrahydromethanopterin reductase-like flavin-dependent oxidoreductase (luciferase family)